MTGILNSFGLILMCRSPVLSSDVTMVPNTDILIAVFLATNMTLLSSSRFLFILITHLQWLIKFVLNNLSTIFHLLQHLLHKLLNTILSSVNLHWLSMFVIIAAHYSVTIPTSLVLLIIVDVRLSIIRQAPQLPSL